MFPKALHQNCNNCSMTKPICCNSWRKKRPEAKTKQTTVVPIPLPVNATRDDSLAHQIKVLQAQLKELQTSPNAVVQVNTPAMQRITPVLSMQTNPSLLTTSDSLKGNWIGEAPTIAVVPFDFERSVFFDLSSTRLGADAKQKLAETLQFLMDFPQEKIVLRGYASPDGNRKFNLRLAQQRQQAVQKLSFAAWCRPKVVSFFPIVV